MSGRRALLDLDAAVPGLFEHYLSNSSYPRFFLDLRNLDTTRAGSAWLAETRAFRLVGISYDPATPSMFWFDAPLTDWYDGLIHFRATGPTAVLPLRYPESW